MISSLLEEEGGKLDLDAIDVPSSSHNYHNATPSSTLVNKRSSRMLGAADRKKREEER